MNTQPQEAFNNISCPVMGFIVDQATRTQPVPLVGEPGLTHQSPFHGLDEPDIEDENAKLLSNAFFDRRTDQIGW